MASNYQLSHLRLCPEANPNLRGGRRECYHSAIMDPFNCVKKRLSSVHISLEITKCNKEFRSSLRLFHEVIFPIIFFSKLQDYFCILVKYKNLYLFSLTFTKNKQSWQIMQTMIVISCRLILKTIRRFLRFINELSHKLKFFLAY